MRCDLRQSAVIAPCSLSISSVGSEGWVKAAATIGPVGISVGPVVGAAGTLGLGRNLPSHFDVGRGGEEAILHTRGAQLLRFQPRSWFIASWSLDEEK